jgi:hypothetical protein
MYCTRPHLVIYVKCFSSCRWFPLWFVMARPLSPHFKIVPALMAHTNHLMEVIYGRGGCAGVLEWIY